MDDGVIRLARVAPPGMAIDRKLQSRRWLCGDLILRLLRRGRRAEGYRTALLHGFRASPGVVAHVDSASIGAVIRAPITATYASW